MSAAIPYFFPNKNQCYYLFCEVSAFKNTPQESQALIEDGFDK